MHWRMLRLKRKQPCLHERRASSPQCLHGCRNLSQFPNSSNKDTQHPASEPRDRWQVNHDIERERKRERERERESVWRQRDRKNERKREKQSQMVNIWQGILHDVNMPAATSSRLSRTLWIYTENCGTEIYHETDHLHLTIPSCAEHIWIHTQNEQIVK